MSEIKIVRISTGEELLCTVDTYADHLRLTDVAILIPTEANSLGLAPFMAYSDAKDGMSIPMSFVMFMVDPVANLKTQYQTMFSKVITGGSKIII